MIVELKGKNLRRTCDSASLKCDKVEDLKPLESIIGQDRAVKALKFGLGIKAFGFNIYVAGRSGTGKLTAVKRFLSELAKSEHVPADWCYINNFNDAFEPKKLELPTGKGKEFKADMRKFLEEAEQALLKAFESDEYVAKRKEVLDDMEKKRTSLFTKLELQAEKDGFLIKHAPGKIYSLPLKEGEPMGDKDFEDLTEKEKKVILEKQEFIQKELERLMKESRELEKNANIELHQLDREVALYAIKILIDELKEKYKTVPEVVTYLEAVQKDILENLPEFLKPPKQNDPMLALADPWGKPISQRYEVNNLIDNSELEGAPLVIELNPTYNNLFGKVEKESQMGALYTDFTLIRKGSLHQANGGYLVIPVEELLRNLFSWDSLKRALRNKEIIIEEAGDRLGFITTKGLKPEPVPLKVQVILIGDPLVYHLLYEYDRDFKELFKVKADFDISMSFNDDNLDDFLAFICKVCKDEKLVSFRDTAIAKVVEYSCRLAENQEKLSTRFGEISDILRESSFYANQKKSAHVNAGHVKMAIEEKLYRSNLLQEKINELIQKEVITIDHTGVEVGQVNGLSVIDMGDIAFGKPNRITATIGIGKSGVVDIERESELGGKIHTKGVLILSGYLLEKFSNDKPMNLAASIVFEQSYGEVEGDSASSAELYALLSGISGVPVQQGIAVTGSVNQKGEIQAIGGVNEKIEGFFEVCKLKGLTGDQGVIIPASNAKNLMLKEEVIETVNKGKFHIWTATTVEDGIEILTGIKAGKLQKDGTYEEGSINYLIDQRLNEMFEKVKKYVGWEEGS